MGDSHEAEFDCREALHRIYHFLDGELTSVRRHEIETHLDGCSPCFQMYGFETELRRVVHDKCRDAVPETLRQRIADAIDHEHAGEDDAATAAAGAHEVEDREGV
jgi:mycothiol system anti-sigma-R factor